MPAATSTAFDGKEHQAGVPIGCSGMRGAPSLAAEAKAALPPDHEDAGSGETARSSPLDKPIATNKSVCFA